MKKYLCFALIACLPLLLLSQNHPINRYVKGGSNLCADISPVEDVPDSLKWKDVSNLPSDREKLVEEATLKALNKLGKLGEDSWFNRYIVIFFGIGFHLENDCISNTWDMTKDKRLQKVNYLYHPKYWHECNNQLSATIGYSKSKRKANAAGASLPKITRINAEYSTDPNTKNCYCGDETIYEGPVINREGFAITRGGKTPQFAYWDVTPWYDDSTPEMLGIQSESKCRDCKVCYREEFNFVIEISPEIFDRKYLMIPSENNRLARNQTEAIMYIVLHELGHIESYLSKESKCWIKFSTQLTEQDNSEESAWEFASTVMRLK